MHRTTYRVFIYCMLVTATLVLVGVYAEGEGIPTVYPKLVITHFVVGLAAFLLWSTKVFWEIRNTRNKELQYYY